MEATYKVGGMTCQGCARSVKSAIERVNGTLGVEVSLETGTVRVTGEHDSKVVADAVLQAGFTVG